MTDWPFKNLQMFGYDCIVADPPWLFELYSEEGERKSAQAQYDCMPLAEIKALPVHLLARGDCLLLLWTCGWALATGQAQEVARAWRFKPITMLNWRKVTPSGKVRMGPGYRVRTTDEPILVCTMGNPKHKPLRSFDGVAREHSRKPVEMYDQVKRCTPAAYRADLFSREVREGFDGWGDQHGLFDPGYVAPTVTESLRVASAADMPLFDKVTPARLDQTDEVAA